MPGRVQCDALRRHRIAVTHLRHQKTGEDAPVCDTALHADVDRLGGLHRLSRLRAGVEKLDLSPTLVDFGLAEAADEVVEETVEEYRQQDLDFLADCKKALDNNDTILYECSW